MAEPTAGSATRDLRPNEAVLLGKGVSGGVATELTSVGLVLPFLHTTIGAPIFFAGLLVPLNTLSKRISQTFTVRFVGTARSNARIIALATPTMAAAIVLISLTFSAIKPLRMRTRQRQGKQSGARQRRRAPYLWCRAALR